LPISANNAAKAPVRSQVTAQSTLKNSTFSDLTADYHRTPIPSCEHPFETTAGPRRHVRPRIRNECSKNAVLRRVQSRRCKRHRKWQSATTRSAASRHGTHHHGGNQDGVKNLNTGRVTSRRATSHTATHLLSAQYFFFEQLTVIIALPGLNLSSSQLDPSDCKQLGSNAGLNTAMKRGVTAKNRSTDLSSQSTSCCSLAMDCSVLFTVLGAFQMWFYWT
jgi:hypothetical protein